MPRFNPLLSELRTYPAVAVDEAKARLVESGRRVFDFGKGDPAEPPPEFVGAALREAIVARLPYPKVWGSQTVRQSIAAYMERRFGVLLTQTPKSFPRREAKKPCFTCRCS